MRLRKLLAAASIATLGALGFAAAPAQASGPTYYGCPWNYICIWRWTYYNMDGGVRNIHPQEIYTKTNQCLNLTGYYYNTGPAVPDNSASLVVNNASPVQDDLLGFFDWPNCNGNGLYFTVNPYGLTAIPNLGTYNMYHKIVSIRYWG
jgi:hypothetical protein